MGRPRSERSTCFFLDRGMRPPRALEEQCLGQLGRHLTLHYQWLLSNEVMSGSHDQEPIVVDFKTRIFECSPYS
jgi:hypothetical protein